mgnify:CR=1 FL=1|tara:strand:- start:1712 stop:2197 length:486 start_codon:yes stop_codon:yes gene_type:complete
MRKKIFINLKILRRTDVKKNYFNWLNDKKNTKYLDVKGCKSLDLLKKYVMNIYYSKDEFLFGIYKNKKHVGNIKAKIYLKKNFAVIGYLIDKKFINQGIATEAIRKIILFVKKKKINNIIATLNKKNIPSSKVLLKNNFIKTNKLFNLKKRKGYDYYLLEY